jgi:transposase InsO family protein
MGVALETESHTVELALLYQLEHDDNVLAVWCQPTPIKLSYLTEAGRPVYATHTPDFLVLELDRVLWIECKPESVFLRLAVEKPNRFVRHTDGSWKCPPGEAVASEHGFTYRLFSSVELNEVLIRNLQYLEDYKRGHPVSVPDDCFNSIRQTVIKQPGTTLNELREKFSACPPDYFNALIARRDLFVDLKRDPLMIPSRVRVFSDRATAFAHQAIAESATASQSVEAQQITVGEVLASNAADSNDAHPPEVELPVARREDLLKGFSEAELQEANRRKKYIELPGLAKLEGIPARTVRNWKKAYKDAGCAYGWGYLGLLPKTKDRGNRTPKLPEITVELANDVIARSYLNTTKKSKRVAHGALVLQCREKGAFVPSYQWFCEHIEDYTKYELTRSRDGRRASYKFEILNRSRPNLNHGDWPMEVAHVDHTLADVELVDKETSVNHGRPWLSLLIDTCTREILAYDLSFDPPSSATCMMLIRECVQLHHRLPGIIVTDNGKEFHSTYFETLMARYECVLKRRPPAKPRFGSVIERMFGTFGSEFFHNLRGNTQVMKNVREVTKSIDPKRLAVWDLETLQQRFEEYCFQIYSNTVHTSLGITPAEARARGIASHGERSGRFIPFDEEFLIYTMPSIPRVTAKVQPSRGVKVNTVYCWCDEMRSEHVENTKIPIRYDPYDAGRVFACIGRKWVKCISHLANLHGRSHREIKAATQMLSRRAASAVQRRAAISSTDLARYLAATEVDEKILEQRRKDNAARVRRGVQSPEITSTSVPTASAWPLEPTTIFGDL